MAGTIFCKKTKGQKKERPFSPTSWCYHYVQYCTMTKHKIGGCCISVSPFGLRLISLEASVSSIKSMVIYCDSVMFSLIKKEKVENPVGFCRVSQVRTVIKTNAEHGDN